MAEFNPDIGGIPAPNMPDQTNASRGLPADRTWETLFEGVGNLIGGAAKVVDTNIQTNIRKDVTNIFAEANKPYDVPPADLMKGGESIQAIQSAWEQGKISDVHYYGLLNTELKSLRVKYPGYEEYVDNIMQDVTGVRPANAFRSAIISALDAEASAASDGEKNWNSWLNSNQADVAFIVGEDVIANPSAYSDPAVRARIKAEVAKFQGIKTNDTYIQNTTEAAVYSTALSSLNMDVQTVVSNLPRQMGLPEGTTLSGLLTAAQGVSASGEDLVQLQSNMTVLYKQVEARIQTQLMQTRQTGDSKPGDPPVTWYGILGESKAEEVKKAVLQPLQSIIDLIGAGDFTMAAYNIKLVEAMKNEDVANMMTGPGGTYFRATEALGKVDPELRDTWIASNPQERENAYTDAIPALLAQIVGEDRNTNTTASEIANNTKIPEADRAAAINGLLDGVSTTLQPNSAATLEQKKQAVLNTYALDADGDLLSLVSPEDFMNVYSQIHAPEITASVKALGDPATFKVYQEAALDRFQAVPEFRDIAGVIKNIQQLPEVFSIGMDDTGSLSVSLNPNRPATGINPVMQERTDAAHAKKINETLSVLNQSFSLLDPIVLPEGASTEDKMKFHKELLSMLSVEYGAGKDKNFFDWLGESFNSMVTPSGKESTSAWSDVVNVSDNFNFVLPGYENQTTTESDYFAVVAGRESGGDDNAANPNSTATGRYQFLDSTYNTYAAILGLTGDKNEPANQQAAMEAFTADNEKALERAGVPVTNGARYAAHFLGARDAIEVLSASDDALISEFVSPRVINANSFLKGKSVAWFKKWMNKKFS